MTNTKHQVNYLPINILNRYELFLVLFDKKPSATITLDKDIDKHRGRLEAFLTKNNIYYTIDSENKNLYFVSKNKDNAFALKRLWNKDTEETEVEKGLLLGYPKQAVITFAKYSKSGDRSKYLSLCTNPYGGYMIRVGFEAEDTKVSAQWRNFVEKENPKLLLWLDNKIKPLLKK